MKTYQLGSNHLPIVRAALAAHRPKLEEAIRKAKRLRDSEHRDICEDELRILNVMIREIDAL